MAWGPKIWRNLDRVTLYGLCWRVWQTAAVPVTLLLVSRNFTPQLQGYYYTFARSGTPTAQRNGSLGI